MTGSGDSRAVIGYSADPRAVALRAAIWRVPAAVRYTTGSGRTSSPDRSPGSARARLTGAVRAVDPGAASPLLQVLLAHPQPRIALRARAVSSSSISSSRSRKPASAFFSRGSRAHLGQRTPVRPPRFQTLDGLGTRPRTRIEGPTAPLHTTSRHLQHQALTRAARTMLRWRPLCPSAAWLPPGCRLGTRNGPLNSRILEMSPESSEDPSPVRAVTSSRTAWCPTGAEPRNDATKRMSVVAPTGFERLCALNFRGSLLETLSRGARTSSRSAPASFTDGR